jgi:hypothetical protein
VDLKPRTEILAESGLSLPWPLGVARPKVSRISVSKRERLIKRLHGDGKHTSQPSDISSLTICSPSGGTVGSQQYDLETSTRTLRGVVGRLADVSTSV